MKKTMRRVLVGLMAIALLVPVFAAFEAHVINVKAHIENALEVEPKEIDFGVVFPQERLASDFTVRLSESFMRQDRANDVHYKVVQRRKPKTTYQKLDVVLSFDLSGSMSDDMAAVKASANSIIDGLKTVSPDLKVGIMSHVDYPAYYDYTAECGYAADYGMAPDYAYKLDSALSSDLDAVKATIQGLGGYYGGDLPQNYARIVYETMADPNVGWRGDAKRIVIIFGDDRPHDIDLGTGGDPGRDEIKGTADDLDWDSVVSWLPWYGIELWTVHSGGFLPQWKTWTGDHAVSLADSGDVVTAISDLYAYADLRPYVKKLKAPDNDVVEDTEAAAVLDKAAGDLEDKWLIDFYVPCIDGAVGTDYYGPIAPKEDDYGLDIWVEVYGLSYATP